MALNKPDPILVNDQLIALQTLLKSWGVEHFCRSMFWVLPKKPETTTGVARASLLPFQFNLIQRQLIATLALRNLLLKARQIGGTTFFLLVRLLMPAITERGVGSLLISQNAEYAGLHFQIAKRAYRYIGVVDPFDASLNDLNVSLRANLLHTEYSNRRELVFDQIESRVMVATAEVEESGQGVTLQHILADEYSRWPGKPEDTLSNVMGALVKDGTLDKNCTANGAAGPFYEDCLRAMNDAAKSDAKFHYFSHWWSEDYDEVLTERQKDEMEQDLELDELNLIAKMHLELKDIAYVGDRLINVPLAL